MKKRHLFTFAALFIACLSVHLSADDLNVQPLENFESSGLPGGPFTPVLKQYYLTNDGNSMLSWSVNSSASWLQIVPKWGLLVPNASVTVKVSLASDVNVFDEGIYTETITFLDIGSQLEQYRNVTVTVDFPDGFWAAPLSLDVKIIEGTNSSKKITIANGGPAAFNYITWAQNAVPEAAAAVEKKILQFHEPVGFPDLPASNYFTISENVPYKEGELLVRFKNHNGKRTGEDLKKAVIKSLGGGSFKRNFRIIPDSSVIKLPPNMTVKQALKRLSKAEDILYAQPNYQVHILSSIPNDTRFSELWGLHNTGQNGGLADADVDAPEAWDILTGSSDVVVAVIDSGVDYTHPDLSGNMWVNPGEIPANGLDDDGNGYVDDVHGYDFYNEDGDPKDDLYHGTHVAGIIGAVGNNNLGVTGVCWNVKIMALKFISSSGTGWTDDAIEALDYSVFMGAKIANNSWGGDSYNPFLKYAIDQAEAADVLFVAGAGNANNDNDVVSFYPASYDNNSIISVMATDRYDLRWSSSNYGQQTVDLAAPGVSILSCYPANKYQYMNGSSMSTAYVSGACALLWSIDPSLSSSQVKEIILDSVDKIDSVKNKCVSGGRLNIYKAISETKVPCLRIEPQAGLMEPNTINDVNILFDTNSLAPDVYNFRILFIPDDPCYARLNIPVKVTIEPDFLIAAPSEDFIAEGVKGGPFQPNCQKYTLTNTSAETLDWSVFWNESWLSVIPQTGSLEPNETIDIDVCLTSDVGLFDPNIYTDRIMFRNLKNGSVKKRNVSLTVKPPDSFTEFFEQTAGQLSGMMITFTPNGSTAYYEACKENITGFPTDPNGGTYVPLWDDDYGEVFLDSGASVLFYGALFEYFYIGSNGYITFGQPDIESVPSLENHFALPRISALFADLNPSTETSISYKQLDDRIAVTFNDVPVFGDKDANNSFQIEMFFRSGQIRISWLNISAASALAGLSEGNGPPGFLFEESDINEYPLCKPAGDFNGDYLVNFEDLAVLAAHWRDIDCSLPLWCDRTDLDLSGSIDEKDLSIFMGNWLLSNLTLPSPISQWKFDEGQGTIAHDSAGISNGTIIGQASWVSGKTGEYALNFDGLDDYVIVGSLDTLRGHNPFTVCAWIYLKNLGVNDMDILSKDLDTTGYGVQILARLNSSGHFSFQFSNGSVFDNFLKSTSVIPEGSWTFVTFGWDGTMNPKGMRIYINGVLDNTRQSKCSTMLNVYIPAFIGAYTGEGFPSKFFDGIIDDVRIYNKLLTAEQIRQLYREGLE